MRKPTQVEPLVQVTTRSYCPHLGQACPVTNQDTIHTTFFKCIESECESGYNNKNGTSLEHGLRKDSPVYEKRI